jgi:hypothetical protein
MQNQQGFPNRRYIPLCKIVRCNISIDHSNKTQNNEKIAVEDSNLPTDHSENLQW